MNVSIVLCRSVDELSLFSGCFLRRDGGLLESEQPVSEHVSVRRASLNRGAVMQGHLSSSVSEEQTLDSRIEAQGENFLGSYCQLQDSQGK